MRSSSAVRVVCLVGLLLGTAVTGHAQIVNGDFASGDFTGWTLFTTANGSLGPNPPPDVVSFDVTGTGTSSAARFQVGGVALQAGGGGGGIYQSVTAGAGLLSVSADIAAWDSISDNGSNADWGTFELLVDAVVLDSWGSASPPCCNPVRHTLSGSRMVTAGPHEIRVRMTRVFLNGEVAGDTPFQYVDNVTSEVNEVEAVPTLGGAGLVGLAALLALLGLGALRKV